MSMILQKLTKNNEETQRVLKILEDRQNYKHCPKDEFLQVIKHGYWPIKLLYYNKHWLSEQQPADIDDMPINENLIDEIGSYCASTTIFNQVNLGVSIIQGNHIECEGHTQLEFFCWNENSRWGNIPRKVFTINKLADVENALKHWPEFIETAWPQIELVIGKKLLHQQNQIDVDQQLSKDFDTMIWKYFGNHLKQQLMDFVFEDDIYSIDLLNDWYEGRIKLSDHN